MGSAPKLTVLSLFTGAGGLDLGLEAAGFSPKLCVEFDEDARKTLKANRPKWKLSEPGDIHELTPHEILIQADLKPRQLTLLAGGPPCQPFSKSAYWANGHGGRLNDPRASTLSAYIKVVECTLPRVLLLENVRGLTYSGKDEGWKLLQSEIQALNRRHDTEYAFETLHVNAADYGIPQSRERVFLVASRDGSKLKGPKATHGNGEGLQPFRTAWDAIGDLDVEFWPDELDVTGKWAGLLPSIPEGSNYLWHTPRNKEIGAEPLFGWRRRYWSFLLKLAKAQPAWTIQAFPGPATGPFHWRSRLLSIEELCRLQTFPAGYKIEGGRTSAQRQVGNAVPSALGELFGLEIRRQFLGQRVRRSLSLIPSVRPDCPKPETPQLVSSDYLSLRKKYRKHPGAGRGPGALRRERELGAA